MSSWVKECLVGFTSNTEVGVIIQSQLPFGGSSKPFYRARKDYHIELETDSIPFSLLVPHRVAIPLEACNGNLRNYFACRTTD